MIESDTSHVSDKISVLRVAYTTVGPWIAAARFEGPRHYTVLDSVNHKRTAWITLHSNQDINLVAFTIMVNSRNIHHSSNRHYTNCELNWNIPSRCNQKCVVHIPDRSTVVRWFFADWFDLHRMFRWNPILSIRHRHGREPRWSPLMGLVVFFRRKWCPLPTRNFNVVSNKKL